MNDQRLNRFIDNLIQRTEEEIAKGRLRTKEIERLKTLLNIPYHCSYPFVKCSTCKDPEFCKTMMSDEYYENSTGKFDFPYIDPFKNKGAKNE